MAVHFVLRSEYSVPGTWNQERSARRISLAPRQPALGPTTRLLERDPERFELRTKRSATSSAELRARRYEVRKYLERTALSVVLDWRRAILLLATRIPGTAILGRDPLRICPCGACDYIGGVSPSFPKFTRGASSVPSGFAVAAAMKILTPGLSSLLSPGT